MAMVAWLSVVEEAQTDIHPRLAELMQRLGVSTCPMPQPPEGFGLIIFNTVNASIIDELRATSRSSTVLAIALAPQGLQSSDIWMLLSAGAADVFVWPKIADSADQVVSRLGRWEAVQRLTESERVRGSLVGHSAAWRSLIRQVVEVAAFSLTSVLIIGESGTGKELIARLIHDLDSRPGKPFGGSCGFLSRPTSFATPLLP